MMVAVARALPLHASSDDLLLLHRHKGDGQVYAHALRRDFALAPRTLACVPALVNAQTSAGAVLDKQIVAASLVAPAALQTIFLPTRLLFAEIVDAAASTVSPLPATQAVVALAQQSAGIMTDRAIAPAQVTLLAQLAQSAPSYRLALGRDVFTDPAGVAQRLQDP